MKRLLLAAAAAIAVASCTGHQASLTPGTPSAKAKSRVPLRYTFATYARVKTQSLPPSYSNPVDPNPPVFRPPTQSCTVRFLSAQQFAGDALVTTPYNPPAGCPGPWSKIILDMDTSVDGTQYDRTMEIKVGQNLIFRGTTSEPPGGPIDYHVQKDVTEYGALFTRPQTIGSELANYFASGINGIYVVNATLTFYQATSQYPAAQIADSVLPISQNGGYASFALNSPSDVASASLVFPANAQRVLLEVYAMGQSNDEFWSFNVPDADVNNAVISSGGTSFREVVASIDGQPAGVAWPFHYIFTGGLDPDGWIPITAIDTHDIQPMLVDLTPFAGKLTDGAAHSIVLSTPNNAGWWMVAGDVLVFDDAGSTHTTGALTSDTLAARAAQSSIDTISQPGLVNVTTTAYRAGTVAGYLDTSHGRVTTTVDYNHNFKSKVISSGAMSIGQDSQLQVKTTTVDSNGQTVKEVDEDYPLAIDWTPLTSVKISQGQNRKTKLYVNGTQRFYAELNRTLSLLDSGALVGASAPQSDTVYQYQDWNGLCYYRHLAAITEKLTTDQTGCNSLSAQALHVFRI